VRLIDCAVEGFLGDPTAAGLPEVPRHLVRAWWDIFRSVRLEFRQRLRAFWEHDEWVSYGMSYCALRRCAEKGRHRDAEYVRGACANAHKAYLRKLAGQRRRAAREVERQAMGLGPVPARPEDADIRLDFAGALSRLSDRDRFICLMRLTGGDGDEGESFAAIGAAMGVHESTALRWARGPIGVIREHMAGHGPTRRPPEAPAPDAA
jgi:hypothetical protein